ncbi:hypothetical protein LH128_03564 [Sphingomonas sp. LH128]|uniref:ThuA domain-containing protein n=1 Tax=Sphingomonas sp. LH128 TaxID=473781 RepID=UPI00027CB4E0|nr:ThuA domain-containing protein [Sphingomonas sp. LH128]EJU14490.1 hypothetical protein LH128_03564 [Sphingomonas sp. LH128]
MKAFSLIGAITVAATSWAPGGTAAARAVTDCPLRDAPFSTASPLMDVLLNPRARALVDAAVPGGLAKVPTQFLASDAPSFSAILALKDAGTMLGMDGNAITGLDRELVRLPVTAADRKARCARYDNDPLRVNLPTGKPHILMFEKINGFKDTPGFNAAHDAFLAMAREKGWDVTVTDRGGAFTLATLRKFDAVVWNNVSGDVLTLSQRKAFRTYIEQGGAYIGVHGSAGDPVYFWDWYADTLLGARFVGHPMAPQFQNARLVVDDPAHPVAAHLPPEWTMKDEWYSFRASPRAGGARPVVTIDETTYQTKGFSGQKLAMGDHPIAWTRLVGKGRMFYSAIGHLPETYSDPRYVAMLEDAVAWAITPSTP